MRAWKELGMAGCVFVFFLSGCGGRSGGTDVAPPDGQDVLPDNPPDVPMDPPVDPPPDGPPDSPPDVPPDGPPTCTPFTGVPVLTLTPIATGLDAPVAVVQPPGDNRLFIVDYHLGQIRIVNATGTLLPTPFLDMGSRISTGNEQGLLGLAFHPSYGTNGRFFINYTDNAGDSNVVEFRASTSNPNVADTTTERQVLFLAQPYSNHNGGNLIFGPDGYLYIGFGDGGSGGDPMGNGQNTNVLLGKMLRIDVDGAAPYGIPPTNPFVGVAGADEIWAYGLRNPWRYSFDRMTGDLYIGDVGQNLWEEIDIQPASSSGGEDYGWNIMEGTHCYQPATGCSMAGLTLPIYDYDHSNGCAVVGGYVYRGCRMPALHGTYFFSDNCGSWLHSFVWDGTMTRPTITDWGVGGIAFSSFGEDNAGEIYITDLFAGTVYRIDPM